MVTFHTNHGDIVIKTFDDKAPETVKNFLDYCREGFYLSLIHIPSPRDISGSRMPSSA